MRDLPEGLPSRIVAVNRINDLLIGSSWPGRRKFVRLSLGSEQSATARRLSNLVLRNFNRCNAILEQYLKRPPPETVMNVMRLAVCEYAARSVPAYVATDQAVRQLKMRGVDRKLCGLANAVLRSVVSGNACRWDEGGASCVVGPLRSHLVATYGDDAVTQMETVFTGEPPLDITPKLAGDVERLARLLDAEILPTGSFRLHRSVQITNLPGYDQGSWWVQDAAAAVPVRMLGDLKGMNVLDMCSAPGGKAMQCIAGGANVVMVDKSAVRIRTLHENLNRTGLDGTVRTCDALGLHPEADFDAVIVDPPCSATGTIRRHPELPFRLQRIGFDPGQYAGFQRKLLERALLFTRPGGLVLYCACSLLPEECEDLVGEFIRDNPVDAVVPDTGMLGVSRSWLTGEGGLRLRPDYWMERGGMDGFYAVLLRKSR